MIAPLPQGEWTTPNGDLANTRYSPLDRINATNVAQLRPITSLSTGVPHGHEGGPLVVNDTMYIVTPFPNNLLAVDLRPTGGALKWTYQPHPDPRAVGIACCDTVNRGASYADGKIVYNTLDAHTIAVDAHTGRELWRTRVGNIDVGETVTMAPLIIKDKSHRGQRRRRTRSHPEPVNPLSGDDPSAREGRKAFLQFNCYGCHGYHAGGGMGVSLRDPDWIYGGSEAQIFATIARGGANGMPSWNQRLTERQIWTLVTYIRTLATDSEIDPPR